MQGTLDPLRWARYYAAAYEDFYRALHTAGEYEEMWAELDTLLGVTR